MNWGKLVCGSGGRDGDVISRGFPSALSMGTSAVGATHILKHGAEGVNCRPSALCLFCLPFLCVLFRLFHRHASAAFGSSFPSLPGDRGVLR